MRRSRVLAVSLTALAVMIVVAGGLALAVRGYAGRPLAERLASLLGRPGVELASGYVTLVDETGQPVLTTGFRVGPGDYFLDDQGRGHRVTRVRGDVAETVAAASGPEAGEAPPSSGAALAAGPWTSAIPLGATGSVIVIYHTHSDESYVPTDGTDSIYGSGGVYDVGETMAAALRVKGFTVVHDYTAHDPHDGGAYPRSRRTVLRDQAYGPTLLFDVHRDSAPASDYAGTTGGTDIQRILMVIGGANPNYVSNYNTASKLKSQADALHPGLVRGILVAQGNYNQDLDPGNIILEMGTQELPKNGAQAAATLWADAVSAYLGSPGP